jgi:hypothetical protein
MYDQTPDMAARRGISTETRPMVTTKVEFAYPV